MIFNQKRKTMQKEKKDLFTILAIVLMAILICFADNFM